jgi:hypothetical protein
MPSSVQNLWDFKFHFEGEGWVGGGCCSPAAPTLGARLSCTHLYQHEEVIP